MIFFDTHFHLQPDDTPQSCRARIAEALRRLPPGFPEIETLYTLAVGGSFGESIRALRYAQNFADARCAVGVHPHAAHAHLEDAEDFSVFRGEEKVAAVGEIGLDYYYGADEREIQKEVFAGQLKLALEWEKPAIVHLRDLDGKHEVYRDALSMLAPFAEKGGRFVIHCYTGGVEFLPRFAELGSFFGVTGMVTFKRAENVRETLKSIPPDRLLLETDSPYLAPAPLRGTENTPGNLPLVAACVAQVLGETLGGVAERTRVNAEAFLKN